MSVPCCWRYFVSLVRELYVVCGARGEGKEVQNRIGRKEWNGEGDEERTAVRVVKS